MLERKSLARQRHECPFKVGMRVQRKSGGDYSGKITSIGFPTGAQWASFLVASVAWHYPDHRSTVESTDLELEWLMPEGGVWDFKPGELVSCPAGEWGGMVMAVRPDKACRQVVTVQIVYDPLDRGLVGLTGEAEFAEIEHRTEPFPV
jgi:hypothetical protein